MKYPTFIQLYCMVIALLFLTLVSAYGDFHFTDRPSFGFSGGGINDPGNWTLSGTMPFSFIGGQIGARYIHDNIPDIETSRTHLRAYGQMGKEWGRVGVHAYGRYGRESVMIQKGLWHGGANVEVKLLELNALTLHIGTGTWAETQTLLEEYEQSLHPDGSGVDFGPRAHLTLKHTYFTANTTFLLNNDKTYRVHSFVDAEIPVGKVLLIEQLFLAVSGGIDYWSETKHIEIEPVNWNWKHELRLRF